MTTTTKRRSPFGDYRSVHANIWDDRDFQRLSPLAKSLWFYLKCKLGQYGIEVVYLGNLPEILNAPKRAIEKALAELETPKPGRVHGWVLHDENVFWLIKGFRFEPWLHSTGDNYKLGAARHLLKLPKLAITDSFRTFYQVLGEDSPLPSPDPCPNTETETDTATATDSETNTNKDHVQTLFIDQFYRANGAKPERIEQIRRQLLAARSPSGVTVKGKNCKAISQQHLTSGLLATMRGSVRDPDKAIVVALLKLTEPILNDRGETLTEAVKGNRQRAEREDELAFARLEKEHPEKAAELQAYAKERFPGSDPEIEVMRRGFYRTCFNRWRAEGTSAA